MNTAAELVAALVASLSAAYPTRTAALSKRPGRVTCVVIPIKVTYESSLCPGPITLETDIHVMAAGSDDQAINDLLTRTDPVADLIRAAGFTTLQWRAGDNRNRPEAVITAVAEGTG